MNNRIITYCFLVLSLVPCGCSYKESWIQSKEGQSMTVFFKFYGDYDVEVQQNPLTKDVSTDAFGINVYYDKEGDGITNDVYAYGLFDNVPSMSITLISNHKYRFTCCLVKDAKNVLYYGQAFGNSFSGYAYPFRTNSSGSTQLGNVFIINESNTYLSGLGAGGVHLKATTNPSAANASQYASINRFYGETDQYTPVPNGTVDIYLKRVVFGAKFVINGLQEGTVQVKVGDFYDRTYSNDDVGLETIYTFQNPYDAWNWEQTNDGPYSFAPTVTVNYTSNRGGTLWNLNNSKTVTFKRNVMTTVNINLSPDLSGMFLKIDEEPLGNDNDIYIGIDGNTLVDIDVNPEN